MLATGRTALWEGRIFIKASLSEGGSLCWAASVVSGEKGRDSGPQAGYYLLDT